MADTTEHHIVLIAPGAPKAAFGPVPHLPVALLSLAAWLESHGPYAGRIKIIDTQINTINPAIFHNAIIVGITAMTGHQIKYGLEIAALARRTNPDALLVWGGIHVSLLPDESIKDPLVDLIVVGEGEQTFLEIADAVFSGKHITGIPGTCFINDQGAISFGGKRDFLDLDSLPLPAYHLVDINAYKGIEHQFDYQSSRGCPYRCGFCYNTVFCGRRYRKKTADKVISELTLLKDKYKVINFGFVDDEFFIEKKRVEAIMDGILKSGRQFGIIASCRLDVVCGFPENLLSKMQSAGVKQIFFGAESGSREILKEIQKDITREQIIEGSHKVALAGIRPVLSFMSGFPGESYKDLEITIDLIRELWERHPLITINGIFPFNPYPGTKLYEKAITLGFKPPASLREWQEWSFQYNPDNPWLDDKTKDAMKTVFYMVRFKYYLSRYEDRYSGKLRVTLIKILTIPLRASLHIRLRNNWFSAAWEWSLFAILARKTFGYL